LDRLFSVAPSPGNIRLAEALYKLKHVESSGKGIDFIYFGQARYGRPAPDYHGSTSESVSVRLIGGNANLEFCKLLLFKYMNLSRKSFPISSLLP
jgi:predicted HTH transcriptional regulator